MGVAWVSTTSRITVSVCSRRVTPSDAGAGIGASQPDLDDLRREQRAAHGGDLVVVDDLTVVDDDGPLGDVLDVRDVVGREEDRRALLLVEAHEQLAEALLGDEVEPDRRLVEEQDLRVVEQARGELAAHPLAEREVPHRLVEEVGGVEQLAELGDAPVLGVAVEPVDRGQHPVRLAGRQLEPQQRPLAEQRADPAGQAPPFLPRGEAEHRRGTGRGMQDAGEDLDRRRLPGSVRTDVGDPLPGRHVEVEVAHGLDLATHLASTGVEDLREPARLDHHPTSVVDGASVVGVFTARAGRAPRRATRCGDQLGSPRATSRGCGPTARGG